MNFKNLDCDCGWRTTVRLGDVAVPKVRNVIRLPVIPMAIGTKFINKCSLFILLPGVIRQPGLKRDSEQMRIYSSASIAANPMLN
jgi:hypothetical protein